MSGEAFWTYLDVRLLNKTCGPCQANYQQQWPCLLFLPEGIRRKSTHLYICIYIYTSLMVLGIRNLK